MNADEKLDRWSEISDGSEDSDSEAEESVEWGICKTENESSMKSYRIRSLEQLWTNRRLITCSLGIWSLSEIVARVRGCVSKPTEASLPSQHTQRVFSQTLVVYDITCMRRLVVPGRSINPIDCRTVRGKWSSMWTHPYTYWYNQSSWVPYFMRYSTAHDQLKRRVRDTRKWFEDLSWATRCKLQGANYEHKHISRIWSRGQVTWGLIGSCDQLREQDFARLLQLASSFVDHFYCH